MDIASYFVPKEFLEDNNYDYEDYLDYLTLLVEEQGISKEDSEKLCDKFTEYIINEWKSQRKNDFDKETE